MKSKLFALALAILPLTGVSAEIASVNFNSVKEDLRELYFSKSENAEVKSKFEELNSADKKQTDEMHKNLMDGKKPLDMKSSMKAGLTSSERYSFGRKIDADLKKELYGIIVGLGLKYELVYDSSDSEAVIFAKSQIDDVTIIVKQAIIELRKKK